MLFFFSPLTDIKASNIIQSNHLPFHMQLLVHWPNFLWKRGWSGGAMVLGKLPVPGRSTIWIIVGQGPTALAIGAGGGCLDIFTLIYPFSPLSPSLWETARYRLKYCLKGPLNPNQPTNQPSCGSAFLLHMFDAFQQYVFYDKHRILLKLQFIR